jgi:hypothetical protein
MGHLPNNVDKCGRGLQKFKAHPVCTVIDTVVDGVLDVSNPCFDSDFVPLQRQADGLDGVNRRRHRRGDEGAAPADVDDGRVGVDFERPPQRPDDLQPNSTSSISEWFHQICRMKSCVRSHHRRHATPCRAIP